MTDEHRNEPDDVALLEAVSRLWQRADPPPDGLAEGALARIAAEDLEFDLLTLVESDAALAGVRSTAFSLEDVDEVGAWSMEYVGPEFRVYVRLTRFEDRTRLDGWVVPARPLTVRLRSEGQTIPQKAPVDEHGRFEFARASQGLCRLSFVDEPRTTARPSVTPPFWI